MRITLQIIIGINDHLVTSQSITRRSWKRLQSLIRKKHKATCAYCGEFDPDGHVDHILPLSKGGTDEIDNLAWACVECNQKKGSQVWEALSVNGGNKQITPISIKYMDNEDPSLSELPVSRSKLSDVAKAVLTDGASFSRDGLSDVLTQTEYRRLARAMLDAGLLFDLPGNRRELSATGNNLLNVVLSEKELD